MNPEESSGPPPLDQEYSSSSTNTIRMGTSRTNIKIENETINTSYGNMSKTFYSTITILGTIAEPKFKLEKNKFIEYKQLLINHARKYGYLSYLEKSTTVTWKLITKRYPSAVNPSIIYNTYREEMDKLYALIIDTIKDHYPNLDSLENILKYEFFQEMKSQDSQLTYIDELDNEMNKIEDYTGLFYKGNPNVLWNYLIKTYEPITESAFGFVSIMNEISNLQYVQNETGHNFIQRFRNLMSKLNKILMKEQPRPGEVLPDTIQSAIILNALPKSFNNIHPLLYQNKKIEPEVIFEQIIKRYESENANKNNFKNNSTSNEQAFYTNYRNNNNHQNRKPFRNNNGYPGQSKPKNAGYTDSISNGNNNSHHSLMAMLSIGDVQGEPIDHYLENDNDIEGEQDFNNLDNNNNDTNGNDDDESDHSHLAIDDVYETINELAIENQLSSDDVAYLGKVSEADLFDFESLKPYTIILDGGSTKHIVCNQKLLKEPEKPGYQYRISGLYGNKAAVALTGTLEISNCVKFRNVCYVPGAVANLISVSTVCASGDYGVWYNKHCARIYRIGKDGKHDDEVMKFVYKRGLYVYVLPEAIRNLKHQSGRLDWIKSPIIALAAKEREARLAKEKADRIEAAKKVRHIPKKAEYQNKNKNSANTSKAGGGTSSNAANIPKPGGENVSSTDSKSNEESHYSMEEHSFLAVTTTKSHIPVETELMNLHIKMGHVTITKELLNSLNVKLDKIPELHCSVCDQIKLTRKHTGTGTYLKPSTIFQRLDVDLVGPISTFNKSTNSKDRVPTLSGKQYILSVIDNYSKYSFVRLLKSKSDAAEELINIIKLIKNQFSITIKTLFSDGGTEFINSTIKEYLNDNGIQQMYPPTNSPSLNGTVERFNRSLLTIIRGIINTAGCNPQLWGEAAMSASIIYNMTPKKVLNGKSAYELVHQRKYDHNKLLHFASDVQALVTSPTGKFDPHTIQGSVMHYDENRLSYRILLQNNKVIYSRDIKQNYPITFNAMIRFNSILNGVTTIKNTNGSEQASTNLNSITNTAEVIQQIEQNRINSNISSSGGDKHSIDLTFDDNDNISVPSQPPVLPQIESTNINSTETIISNSNADSNVVINEQTEDFSKYNIPIGPLAPVPELPPNSHMTSSGRISVHRTFAAIDEKSSELNPIIALDTSDIIDEDDPITWKQIQSSKNKLQWINSMKDEINSLTTNNVLTLVERNKNTKLLKTKWVYKLKRDHLNIPIKIKSRIVAKGFLQEAGVDYQEIFAPVVRFKSIKLLVSIAAQYDLELFQIDFATAFLNADLHENIFISIPNELNDDNIDTGKYCYKVNRALYGLKQSPILWNKMLIKSLNELGYSAAQYDSCVFMKHVSGYDKPIYITAYVDDLSIYCHKSMEYIWIQDKEIIKSSFKIDDIGKMEYCLKMRITKLNNGYKIDQQGYIISLLKEFGMNQVKGTDNPCMSLDLTEPVLYKNDDNVLNEKDHSLYRRMIGSLLYLSNTTRIDITFPTNFLARFSHRPTDKHMKYIKNIFRYLSETQTEGLVYIKNTGSIGSNSNDNVQLQAYSDADWGSDKLSRSSTTGYVIMINSNPIHWISQRQRGISQSSTEAEFVAMSMACRELVWFKNLLTELLTFTIIKQPILFVDNQAAIQWATGENIDHQKTKHIDIRYKYVRNQYQDGNVDLKWVPTKHMKADLLTKGLTEPKFTVLRKQLVG